MSETQELPLYNSREQVRALKVAGSTPTSTTFGTPWNLTFQQPGWPSIEVGHAFMQVYQPKADGYYILRNEKPATYMDAEEFERLHMKVE